MRQHNIVFKKMGFGVKFALKSEFYSILSISVNSYKLKNSMGFNYPVCRMDMRASS